MRGGAQGDLLCRVTVETPINLSSEQKDMIRNFSSTIDGKSKHSPQASTWFDGVKKFFDGMSN